MLLLLLLWLCCHGVLKLMVWMVVPVTDVDACKKILSHLGPTLKNHMIDVEFAKQSDLFANYILTTSSLYH